MPHSFKLARGIARYRAPLVAAMILTIVGCNTTDSMNPSSNIPSTAPTSVAAPPASVSGPELATANYAGGIPMGTFGQPNSTFGSAYNGALRIIWAGYLLGNLAEIKARGGRIVLDMAGNQNRFKDSQGRFSLTKWKALIDQYKKVNFASYINDGTIIGHYLVDEPNDKTNWNGTTISPATVEEMAKYSKQLWPGMATIVRAEPGYMAGFSGSFRYLDAAWAQYVTRKGSADAYLSRNVADAQKKGLALVVGLNISKGGNNNARMTASQIQSWGSAMLGSTYPCAFISWQYSSDLLSGSMKDAMASLRSKAQNRGSKGCRVR